MTRGATWPPLERLMRRAVARSAASKQLQRHSAVLSPSPTYFLSRQFNSVSGDGGHISSRIFASGSIAGTDHYGSLCDWFQGAFGGGGGDGAGRSPDKGHHRRLNSSAAIAVTFESDESLLKNSNYLHERQFPKSIVGIPNQVTRQHHHYHHHHHLMTMQQPSVHVSWHGYSSSAPAGSVEENANRKRAEEGEMNTGGDKGGEKNRAEGEQEELKKEDLIALLADRETAMAEKDDAIASLKDALLRSYADMENLRERTRREVDSIRKFAVQDFAKGLLDIADNFGRAMSVVPSGLTTGKIEELPEGCDALKLFKDLAVGVEMTEKQLLQLFKKYGVVKFDPVGEEFNPNEHQAMFEVADGDDEKMVGKVAIVTKVGYKLQDRILRPAEVGVFKKNDSASD